MDCPICNKPFIANLERDCKKCYEERVANEKLSYQCLEIASRKICEKYSDEHPDFQKKVFDLAKHLFNEGKSQKFSQWK